MKYVIYAAECIYQGLHGIEDWSIYECDNEEEAFEIAEENSLEIMNSYSCVYETLNDDIETWKDDNMSEDEIEELTYELYRENLYCNVYKIKNEFQNLPIEDLESTLYNDPQEFIEKYCE